MSEVSQQLEELPQEVLFQILGELLAKDLSQVNQVNTFFANLSKMRNFGLYELRKTFK